MIWAQANRNLSLSGNLRNLLSRLQIVNQGRIIEVRNALVEYVARAVDKEICWEPLHVESSHY